MLHGACSRSRNISLKSENDQKFLQQALLEMNMENPELRDRIFNGELVVVDQDTHLQVTREALEVQKTLRP